MDSCNSTVPTLTQALVNGLSKAILRNPMVAFNNRIVVTGRKLASVLVYDPALSDYSVITISQRTRTIQVLFTPSTELYLIPENELLSTDLISFPNNWQDSSQQPSPVAYSPALPL